MKRSYEAHEICYREMREAGTPSWDEQHGVGADARLPVDPDTERFLTEALGQGWAPARGSALELGCGTGPLARWLSERDFDVLGVDVSETAIAMAVEQARGMQGVRFIRADACDLAGVEPASFDLVLDGHCLHCIVEADDRRRFLQTSRRLLRPGGLLLVDTMCAPADRRGIAALGRGQRLRGGVIYAPSESAAEYENARRFGGRWYLATRRLAPWRSVLAAIRGAGFEPLLVRLARWHDDAPCSGLSVAALAVGR